MTITIVDGKIVENSKTSATIMTLKSDEPMISIGLGLYESDPMEPVGVAILGLSHDPEELAAKIMQGNGTTYTQKGGYPFDEVFVLHLPMTMHRQIDIDFIESIQARDKLKHGEDLRLCDFEPNAPDVLGMR